MLSNEMKLRKVEYDAPGEAPTEDRGPARNETAAAERAAQEGAACLLAASPRSEAEHAWRVAYSALDMARLVSGASVGALLACDGAGLRLLATRGAEQEHLDLAQDAWGDASSGLRRGQPYAHQQPPFVLLPCVDGFSIVGVLLLAWETEHVPATSALSPLRRVLGASLRRLGVSDGVMPRGTTELAPGTPFVRDTHALALHVLLEEHEWNVSRVARALEVTRMTIYNRMHAAGIERVRVRKSRRRRQRQLRAVERPVRAAEPAVRNASFGAEFDGQTAVAP